MALVNDNNKTNTVIEGVLNMLYKIGSFAVFKGVITFLGELLPIYKATVVFLKT